MSAADWAALRTDLADIAVIVGGFIVAIIIYLAVCATVELIFRAVRAVWRAIDRCADRGIQRVIDPDHIEALVNATREPRPCSDPPCSPEDGWACDYHAQRTQTTAERVGKHRAVWEGSLDDLDSATIHEITDAAWRRR